MRHLTRTSLVAALVLAAGCVDRTPSSPTSPEPDPLPPLSTPQIANAQRGRQERLARRLAVALNRPAIRKALLAELSRSRHPEGKVHFQWLMASRGAIRSAMAGVTSETAETVGRDVAEVVSLELYFPVPEHRATWDGGPDLLVATGIEDEDIPVAFDIHGQRLLLDPSVPPRIPVLALVPSEQVFPSETPRLLDCDDCLDSDEEGGEPTGGGTEGGASDDGSNLVSPGLYMTYASFVGTFESWLKGSPEFEVHVLGQDGSSQNLKSYQCVGEHAGGPYVYDQNKKTWSGNVVVFSQAQLDDFKVRHPGQALRITIVEDDDGPCEIKTKGDNLSDVLKAVDAIYRSWTGGTDRTSPFGKYFSTAISLQQVFKNTASWLNTNDEIVGTAVEDAIVGLSWPGANWIVKGENNVTNGGIHLEIR